jgi:hypothetical protein
MRANAFYRLLFALCLTTSSLGQANWSPGLPEHRPQPAVGCNPLGTLTVRSITLDPGSARKHYNIQITTKQQFVMIENIATTPPESEKQCYHDLHYGSFKREDLIDAIVIPGEAPQHGQIKTIADFDRLVAACTPGCLIFARHKNYGNMSDIVQQGLLHPNFISYDGIHACDRNSKYVYNIHFDPSRGHEIENWFPPSDYPLYCTYHAPPPPSPSQSLFPTTTEVSGTEQEIAKIRNGPHEAMPAAQSSQASLGGQTGMTIENGTGYTLYFYLSGPSSQSLQIPPNSSQTLNVPPGQYEVAAKVSDPSVIPYYGNDNYAPNSQYSHHFYVSTQR